MSGIFGLFNLDGAPLDREVFEAMRQTMAGRERADRTTTWIDGPLGIGQIRLKSKLESREERFPAEDPAGSTRLACVARLDNRDDLHRLLDIPPEQRTLSDRALILQAYAIPRSVIIVSFVTPLQGGASLALG
ncbi:MAG: hypothetical protein HQK60_02580 [Deltaproteobacteria bacterium]|nr:hypothetical protein [Deltaproteobacteria bacterium]